MNFLATSDTLVREFRKVVRDQKKNLKPYQRYKWAAKELSGYNLDNLAKYLRTYRLHKEGTKWNEIMKDKEIKEIGEKCRSIENESDRRLFQNYRTNAGRIIENLKLGIFPSYYGGPEKQGSEKSSDSEPHVGSDYEQQTKSLHP